MQMILRGYVEEENMLFYPLSGHDVFVDKHGKLRCHWFPPQGRNDPDDTDFWEMQLDLDTGLRDCENYMIFENDLVLVGDYGTAQTVFWNAETGEWAVGENNLFSVVHVVKVVGNAHTGETRYNQSIHSDGQTRSGSFCCLCDSWYCKSPNNHK
jgi:hypothetical protein